MSAPLPSKLSKAEKLTTALKEWSVAIDALANGETILLLRKGGIKENSGKFSAAAEKVVLLPTFEHQKPELLKPQYKSAVAPVEKGWHPDTITLKAWAQITDIFLTDEADKVAALTPFHIWQANLAQERLKWKPKQPLYVMALRAYRFPEPVVMPWYEAYGGCKSWVEMGEEIEAKGREAIAEPDYTQQVLAIKKILHAPV